VTDLALGVLANASVPWPRRVGAMEGVSETELFLGDGLDAVAAKVGTTCPSCVRTSPALLRRLLLHVGALRQHNCSKPLPSLNTHVVTTRSLTAAEGWIEHQWLNSYSA
jgi:hypothetical protein